MLGNLLTEFILHLRTSLVIAEYDEAFLRRFAAEFRSFRADEHLTPEQLAWLVKAFEIRWKAILHSTGELYTVNQSGNNAFWIELARNMGSSSNKSYQDLLMPTVTNNIEANTLKRVSDYELSDLLMSDDGKHLYSINSILSNLKKGLCGTYQLVKGSTKCVSRSLTLGEWSQMRLKLGSRPVTIEGAVYLNFSNFLTREGVYSKWVAGRTLPVDLLHLIFEFIKLYYSRDDIRDDPAKFSKHLMLWIHQLDSCSTDDLNCLYGQIIKVEGESICLIDILLDSLQSDISFRLNKRMLGLVRWLSECNASFIIPACDQLSTLYNELHLGNGFHVDDLRVFLEKMLVGTSLALSKSITALMVSLRGKPKIDVYIMSRLIDIYRLRWDKIKDTPMDYLRSQGEGNILWIRLAQILSGSGYFKRSYYALLIPTLTIDIDPILKTSITYVPLSEYILARDSKSLIFLGNCKSYYQSNGVFFQCNTTPSSPLTDLELERMNYCHMKYHRYIKLARGVKVEDHPIERSTVLAVFDLVNTSLYSKGLKFAHNYTEEQLQSAERAYYIFYGFLHKLSDQEREKLYGQRILWNGRLVTFKSVLDDVRADECVAVCGQFLAKMVIDYAPYLMFNDDIEARARVNEMRAETQRKVFSDYTRITHDEATRRIKILAASLMSYAFEYVLSGESLAIWDCINRIGSVPKAIFQLIEPMIQSGNYTHARHVYMSIIEGIICPNLRSRDTHWLTRLAGPTPTQNWIDSIANQTLFTSKKSWFKPELLIAALLPIPPVDARIQALLQVFIEEIVHTYAQHQSIDLKEIRINIKFSQFLRSLDDAHRLQILALLERSSASFQPGKFHGIYAGFIIRRLESFIDNTARRPPPEFFSRTADSTRDSGVIRRTDQLRAHLLDAMDLDHHTPRGILDKLIAKIGTMPKQFCVDSERSKMRDYLGQLRHPISLPTAALLTYWS